MPKYEIAIAVTDEQDLPSGHKRKKEGDIVSVRPYPRNCGRKVINQSLVVIVESNATFQEMLNLTAPLYTDGLLERPESEILQGIEVKPIAKHKYMIPLDIIKNGWLPDLDLSKVRDKGKIYQPFKSDVQLVQKFDGMNGHRILIRSEVDTQSAYAAKNVELVIDINEKVSFAFDKHLGSFKFAKAKEYGI